MHEPSQSALRDQEPPARGGPDLVELRPGFKACWQEPDYGTIVKVAEKRPDAVLQEDENLLMYCDNALTWLGED